MTVPATENQAQDAKPTDRELNFRKQEEMFKRQLDQERQARLSAEQKVADLSKAKPNDDDDDDSEPYVDHKKLDKRLSSFERQIEEKINKAAEEKALLYSKKDKQESWIKNNPDFYEVMQHAEKFAQKDPDLAETILEMPEGFERQKLVYKNIKALGLHKPEVKQPSIQEKIDANRRSPYYQPSGVGSAPYASQGDFSAQGQKNAYDKMQELKQRLRI